MLATTSICVSIVSGCLMVSIFTGCHGYDNQNNNLTTIPTDIPTTATVVDLNFNSISRIDTLPAFSELLHLYLTANLLVVFPNLCSVGATLKTLNVIQNEIGSVDPTRLECLVALQFLMLGDNRLVSMPDVSVPGMVLQLFDLSKNNFNNIPRLPNLATTVTEFWMSDNNLKSVSASALRQFTSLEILHLVNTQLESFPDISSLANSLVYIYFSDNQITDMPSEILKVMTKLRFIDIPNNKLTHFPDFCESPSKDVIQEISLYDNQITHIPLARFNCLSVLVYVGLSDNPITSVSNLCHMTATNRVSSMLPSGVMNCDCHLRWLKRIEETQDFAIFSPFRPCGRPAALVGVNWEDLSISNLTCEDLPFVSSMPVALDATYRCHVYDVVEWRPALSMMRCAGLCLRTIGCEYFRYGDPSVTGNQDNCGLTDVAAPVANRINDPRPEAWYSLD